MSAQPHESTSEPIRAAALSVGAGISAVLGLLGVAVTLGVLSSEQADQLTAAGNYLITALPQLAAAIIGVVTVITGIVASLTTAWAARKNTVPKDSDRYQIVDPNTGPLNHP